MRHGFRSVPVERRGLQRQLSLLAAKILLVNEVTFDCAIRDISDAGARIRLACLTALPDKFQLIEVTRGVAFDATVIWRDHPYVGLQLTKPVDLTAPHAPEDLRRLWLDCAPR